MRQLKRNFIPELSVSQVSEFLSKIDIGDINECWNWNGSVREGDYPKTKIDGKKYRASRIVLFLKTREQDHEAARHTCDNRKCCNPNHLVWGTLEDNMKDKVERNRSSRLPGVSNGRAKLTEVDVRYIRDTFSSTNCTKEWLAECFGVSVTTIGMVINRTTWKHIP